MIKALIVDDEPLVRRGIRSMLPFEAHGMEWVGEASSGEEALELLKRSEVDLLFTDITMPGMDGLELVRAVKQDYPRIRSVVLTCHHEFDYLQQALRLGAIDYMVKTQLDDDSAEELLGRLAEHFRSEPGRERREETTAADAGRMLEGWSRVLWFVDDAAYNELSGYVVQNCQGPEWKAALAKASEEWKLRCPALAKLAPQLAELETKQPALLELGVWVRAVRAEAQKLLRNTMYSEEVIYAILKAVDLLGEQGRLSQPEICKAINMSISYFSKSFKEIVGASFVAYVQELNIRNAQRLLQTTNAPVYQIAEQAGFQDEKYFGRIFRLKTGLSPSEYRLRYRSS